VKAGFRKVIIFALPGNVLKVSPIMDQYICTGEVSAAKASKVSPIMDPNMRGFLRASSRWRRNVDFNVGQRRTVKTASSSSKNTAHPLFGHQGRCGMCCGKINEGRAPPLFAAESGRPESVITLEENTDLDVGSPCSRPESCEQRRTVKPPPRPRTLNTHAHLKPQHWLLLVRF